MWNDRYANLCKLASRACFDPATLMTVSVGSALIGGGTSLIGGLIGSSDAKEGAELAAQGTIAGGDAALLAGEMQQKAAYYQAEQEDENASLALASGQRQALDTTQRTNLAISTARAGAAGNGVNAAVGSPATIQGQIAQRGSYNAAMDMFNGEATATGMHNEAAGTRYSGDAALVGGQLQQRASRIQAQATLAGGKATSDSLLLSGIASGFNAVGTGAKTYGGFAYPQTFRV